MSAKDRRAEVQVQTAEAEVNFKFKDAVVLALSAYRSLRPRPLLDPPISSPICFPSTRNFNDTFPCTSHLIFLSSKIQWLVL
jgi:hypothetical protein